MKLRTLTLAGIVALVAVPAFANDGREYRAIVMEGLRAPALTETLENRQAIFAPTQVQSQQRAVVTRRSAQDVNGD